MAELVFQSDLAGVGAEDLEGFFEGWPTRLGGERLLQILQGSQSLVLARDGREVVGFINAVGDGSLMAFIPLLEVKPAYRGSGLGSTLVQKLVDSLEGYYGIDLLCDPSVAPFYEQLGFGQVVGMCLRRPQHLRGKTAVT